MSATQISTETPSRTVGRPFPKGVSGNHGGRPRGIVSKIREATDDGQEMIDLLLGTMRDDAEPMDPVALNRLIAELEAQVEADREDCVPPKLGERLAGALSEG